MKKACVNKPVLTSAFSLTAVAGMAFGFSATGQGSGTNRPNILMILVDDLGWGDIGLHGNTAIETPNLDRLGRESARFSNFYVEPVCAPTRSSLMTGRYYLRTGVYGVSGAEEYLNLDETTFADLLQKDGYATGMSGKWHLGDAAPYDPGSRGFQSVLSTGHYYEHENPSFVLPSGERTDPVEGWGSELIADHAIAFMEENRSRPFVYFLSFPQPHNPWHCPDPYMQKYLDKGFSNSLSVLYGMIEHMDTQIGRVLDAMESLGLDRDTVVLFASDNGPIERPARPGFPNLTDEEWALRNPSDLKGKKAQVWENGVRVPLFVRWRGKIEPTVVSEPVHVTDLFPTFLDWAGTPLPPGNLPVDGTSLRPLLNGDPELWGERIFFSRSAVSVPEVTEGGVTRLDDKAQIDYFFEKIAAWEERYKFVKFNQHHHLFQIHNDPTESADLSSTDPERTHRLGTTVGAWFSGMMDEPGSFQKPVFHVVPHGVDRIRMIGSAAFELHGGVELNQNAVRVIQGGDLLRVASVNGTMNWAREGDGAKYRLQVVGSDVYDITLEGVFTQMTGDLVLLAGERMQSMPVTVGNRIEFRGVEMDSGRQDLLIRLENVEQAAVDPLEINAVVFSRSMPPPPLTQARWSAATDGFWADAGNWEPSRVPCRSSEVTLPENVRVTIQDLHAEAASIHLQNGTLFLHQSPSSSLLVEGDLVQQGGQIHQRAGNTGKIIIGGNYLAEAGEYKVLQGNENAIRIAGDLTASPGFQFTFVLHNNPTFGNLLVNGQTDLGGAEFQLANHTANTTVTDEKLILIRNPSSHPVQGSFGNAVFGQTSFLINDRRYVLDLTDADGDGVMNDIALIATTEHIDTSLSENRGERLYNGIVLPEVWPPRNMDLADRSPMKVPYLDDPPHIIPIDVGRQLFVDDFLIEETDLVQTFHMLEKYEGNPILKPETAIELSSARYGNAAAVPKDGGVWWDPDKELFRMWYEAGWIGVIAYAESEDGLQWTRPELDVVPGSNQVSPPGVVPDSWTVVPAWNSDDPGVRWTLFVRPPGGYGPGVSLTSPDGIHWDHRTATGSTGDRSTHFYNPFRGKWVYSLRSSVPGRGRARHYYETDDFMAGARWTDHCKVPWAMADEKDPPDPDIGNAAQLYNLNAVAYESLMLGFFQIHRGPPNAVGSEQGLPKITELNFAYSRDGFHWHRPDRRAHIPAAREDVWDRAYIQSVGGICVIQRDSLWFYYTGFQGNPDKKGGGMRSGMYDNGSTGIAFLRRDGFVSMDAGSEPGRLTTRPVTFSGRHLFVNVDAPGGHLRAEVQDTEGNPIEPFTMENCFPLSVDSTLEAVTWDGGSDLSVLAGQPVRFRFELADGSLYAFWISKDGTGRSDGYVAGGGPGYTGPTDTVGRAVLK